MTTRRSGRKSRTTWVLVATAVLALGLALALGVAGVRATSIKPPAFRPRMVHRARAIVLTRQAVGINSPGSRPTLVAARYTAYGNVSKWPFESPSGKFVNRPRLPVWSIIFKGKFPPVSCPPPGGECLPALSMQVVLNAWTGRILFLQSPAP